MLGSDERDILLDAVFRNVETGLCVLSDVGVVLRANDLWLQSMQLTAEATIGRTLSTLAPDRAALIFDAAAQHSRGDVPLPRRPRREGGVWEERLTRLHSSAGPLLLLSSKPSVELATAPVYATAFDNVHDALVLLEAIRSPTGAVTDWLCLDANEAVAALMKFSREQVVGKRLSALLSPEQCQLVSSGYARVLSTGESWRYEARVGDAEYLLKAFRIDADRIGAAAFDLTAVRVIVRSAERALTRSRAELSALIEKLPIGVFVCDHEEVVYANPTFAEYCRRSTGELIGQKLEQLAAPGAAKSPEEGKEWEIRRPDGQSVTLACSTVRSIEFEGRQAELWTCRDLSPLKAMQAQLIHTDRLATVGMLAAGVAHEINNPLAFMLVALELIEESLRRAAPRFAASELAETFDSLRDAREGAQRVRAIVSELKAFSRADQDELVTLDLRKLLESALAMAMNEIKSRARLVRNFESAPCVVGNEARLGQVFLNLLVNAAHAIPEGRPEDNEICVVLKSDPQGRAVVEVLDTGTGVEPELLDRIFAPFFTTKAGSGTGLGLAISRSTIDALGGEITVENRPHGGAIARVTLLPGRVERERTPSAHSDTEALRPRRAHVLVVDDEIAICGTFRRLLKAHDVTTETNACDAWARFERGERFDVIFCDVMMPGMTGMELHQRVQSAAPEQADRFVFMTGGTFTQSATDFLGRVRNPRLDKPFDARQIRQIVNLAVPADACAESA